MRTPSCDSIETFWPSALIFENRVSSCECQATPVWARSIRRVFAVSPAGDRSGVDRAGGCATRLRGQGWRSSLLTSYGVFVYVTDWAVVCPNGARGGRFESEREGCDVRPSCGRTAKSSVLPSQPVDDFYCRARRRRLTLGKCLDDFLNANALDKRSSACWSCLQGRDNRESFSRG